MVDIRKFNTDVYDYLNGLREENPSLRYTYRKSNYGSRLDDGFWFYGNENHICISFWTGMDWKNGTPNVAWFFYSNGECLLEINVSDSDRKRKFVEEYIVPDLDLYQDGRKYVKLYGGEGSNGIEFLNLFINGITNEQSDKAKIDTIITNHSESYFIDDNNGLNFINQYEFRSRDLKIQKYKRKLDVELSEIHEPKDKPSKLSSIRIFNYGEIRNASILNLDFDNQWVFIVGENGSGKTMILKAISTILGYKLLNKDELATNPDFQADVSLFMDNGQKKSYQRNANEDCSKQFPLVSGLAIFGPNRLISQKDRNATSETKKPLRTFLRKKELFSPLWDYAYRMLDIENQFYEWEKEKKEGKGGLEKRRYYVTTLLSRIVPGLYDIRFETKTKMGKGSENIETKYVLKKDDLSEELEKDWRELPSGTRSVFAMVSEILIRLYHYQKDIVDPAELKGIVIIDEIDLHLHPKAQRDLVKDLSSLFRNVQFIVATHSPIPLLGAPKNSAFISVTRSREEGIILNRLMHLEREISKLTPNILLTSEIFGDSDIYSENWILDEKIHTEDTGSDIDFKTQLKSKLSQELTQSQIAKIKSLIESKDEI